MKSEQLRDFLKVLTFYELKRIPRNSSNHYQDEKDGVKYRRRETTAEHICSALKLADYFLVSEPEFSQLDRTRIYSLLLYHDDVEIETGDIGISEREKRRSKEKMAQEAIPSLAKRIPKRLVSKLMKCDEEYRAQSTPESRFARAIDKMDSLVHELQYPEDWGPKGFDEKNVREWFQPAFEYSTTFMNYFEALIQHLNNNGFFEPNQKNCKCYICGKQND